MCGLTGLRVQVKTMIQIAAQEMKNQTTIKWREIFKNLKYKQYAIEYWIINF